MYANKMNIVSCTMALSLFTGAFLAGCSSNGSDSSDDTVETQSTGSETTDIVSETTDTVPETTDSGLQVTEFDGTWRAECTENRVFMVPEEDQPGGHVQRTLTIDSSTNAFSTTEQEYTDSQCTLEDPEESVSVRTGKIRFDGVITTSSGLEATVVYYDYDGSSPDLIGLLYRDGNALFLDARESTLIEDVVPVKLALLSPWQLVN